jgi:hypothetical protein
VLPAVASTIVPPGFSSPRCSASSIIDTPMRSLIEPAGFSSSSVRKSAQGPVSSLLISSIGVLPTISSTLPYTFMVVAPPAEGYCACGL